MRPQACFSSVCVEFLPEETVRRENSMNKVLIEISLLNRDIDMSTLLSQPFNLDLNQSNIF